MKFLDEYRDSEKAKKLIEAIHRRVSKNWNIMEICGGQTHSILKYGIDELLPKEINLIHGPGCPVCVTPIEKIDKAIEIASNQNVIFCSYGDMLRVPGSHTDLLKIKAQGFDVRIVYSPVDAVNIAKKNPEKEIVFFAVGFETTAPPNALAIFMAHQQGLINFTELVSHVCVPPAIKAILDSINNRVQGLLAAGHVCTVMGFKEYEDIAKRYKIPVVVTGFEPLDILQGIYMCILQLENDINIVENQYSRAVKREGNVKAREIMNEVFEICDRKWRGIGEIKDSGFKIKVKYEEYDAEIKFGLEDYSIEESKECKSGLILQGLIKPVDCSVFGNKCTPEHPLGATMVSSEGACSAYYLYKEKKLQ
ncbi:MAG: hydrogenase formation protein HypD [Ignavibacteriae bacterium]|nr:hydrogenase formation protein HypD [Ignavibacteriota bacterium]